LHIVSYAKEIFGWALNHFTEAVPLYCTSLKSYVHVNHIITDIIRNSLSKMLQSKDDSKDHQKVYQDCKNRMEEKFEHLGITMLNFILSRIKLYFIL
jgi:hypothetical protein